MKFKLYICALLFSSFASAERYWPAELVSWNLSLNNGVAYITSEQFPSHCNYSRAQINMNGTEFNKAMYAYALSAKARNKKLRYVIDRAHTNCVISGLQEVDRN
ncbi:hypothetical protein [Pseudoalteromonas marina]|jgi:hypothetical protein|uniref:hypothetical protein n=1 Tax=Pseudoalteromonas marina TaxID=267375 RepID=UPI0023F21439|nr:hypothetical protein [Pseudoalteromonas marina]